MKSIIFYGAGQNAREKIDHWVEQGLEPVCFADADINKQHTYFNEWEILPLLDAIKQYPDYVLYCTQNPANVSEVRNYLHKFGIPNDRIKTCEPEVCSSSCCNYGNTIYSQLHTIYNALQDDLSRKLFMAKVEFSLSLSLESHYRTIICDEYLEWLKTKTVYTSQRYGVPGLWELLKDNYPIQKNKLFLIADNKAWSGVEWILDRFLEAMPKLNITFEGCLLPYSEESLSEYKGIKCLSEKEFLAQIDKNTRIVVGFASWHPELEDIIQRYKNYANILFPIGDTAFPQYIEPNIFEPQEEEIFVDIGVYNLLNSLDFVKWANKGYKKIYAFEPDKNCYFNSQKILNDQDIEFKSKVELINKGVGAENCILNFPKEYKSSGKYNGETIATEVVALDSYLHGEPVTFVKMDVEGAELDVLYGMKETIIKYKPKLAVCIYHKYEDVFTIPSYLLGLVPEYKFYIRHYASNQFETVLFCKI